jgi:hypothetical protein
LAGDCLYAGALDYLGFSHFKADLRKYGMGGIFNPMYDSIFCDFQFDKDEETL